jgi:ferric-dicitrate binding protein FerR (iron transport regulator)
VTGHTGHTILKGSEWVLSAERAPGAPEAIYGAECMTCEAASAWVDNDPKPIGVWAIEHTRHDPEHRQFLVTTQRHWRVDPVRPAPVPRPRTTPPARAHARPGHGQAAWGLAVAVLITLFALGGYLLGAAHAAAFG